MRAIPVLGLFVLGTVLCAMYLDGCSAASEKESPATIANSQSKTVAKAIDKNQKQTNSSALIHPKLLRAKRQACRNQEHWTHRCRNDCECSQQRYCSSYGFCHARNRDKRQNEAEEDDDADDLENAPEEDDENEADEEDNEGDYENEEEDDVDDE